MKPLPIFYPLPPGVDESKLESALKESSMPCKVIRDGRSSVKICPTNETVLPDSVRKFVDGFAAGYMAF